MKACMFCTLLLLLLSHLAYGADGMSSVTKSDCRKCGIDCKTDSEDFSPLNSFSFKYKGRMKKILAFSDNSTASAHNADLVFYLLDESRCSVVLSGTGGSGVNYIPREGDYPIIVTYWHMSADESIINYYSWNGKRYVDSTRNTARELKKGHGRRP